MWPGETRDNPPAPVYVRIKRLIRERILSGEYAAEGRIPSENCLVRDLGVSRMTVNRALRELSAEGVLLRLPGVGTFVAPAKAQSDLLEVKNIADDIRARGHLHAAEPRLLRSEPAKPPVTAALGLPRDAPVFHLVCVHREDGVPVQLEDRFVNPAVAPRFLGQDFTATTATEYLLRLIPASAVEHVIEAVCPPARVCRYLEISAGEPCLLLRRTTWSRGTGVTQAALTYPGSRYHLRGRFVPQSSAEAPAGSRWGETA